MMKSLLGRLRFTARKQDIISQSYHQQIHRCLFSTQHGDSPTLQKFAVRLDVFARIVVQGGGFSFSRSSKTQNLLQWWTQANDIHSSLLPSFSLFFSPRVKIRRFREEEDCCSRRRGGFSFSRSSNPQNLLQWWTKHNEIHPLFFLPSLSFFLRERIV